MRHGKFSIAICLCTVLIAISFITALNVTQVTYAEVQNVASSAECLAVIESSTNRLLYGKNINKMRPMASTTKIATAITVLENCDNLDKIVVVPDKAAGVEGSSIYLAKGEKVKVIDLLYGLMLQSGNDCAETLAITVGGSIEKFAALMNVTAVKAGAKNSNFTNPHGLHNDNHYTTAYDLALISSYAMENETFKKIVSTKCHKMPWEGRDYDRVINNKNKILNTFDGGDGIKTGFTKKAGRCLVSSATRNGMQIICVALNCGPMFEECSAFMEKAFKEYSLTLVCPKHTKLGSTAVTEGKKAQVSYGSCCDLYYPLKDGEIDKLKYEYETAENLSAPIKIGTTIGKFKLFLDNQLLFSQKLITIDSVDGLSVIDKLKDLINDWNK